MLTSKQRSFLSGLAQRIDPTVYLGKAGASEAFRAQFGREIEAHELVKLRFADFKGERREIAEELAASTGAEIVRVIGNVAVFYREHSDPDKRRIELPASKPASKPAAKPAPKR